MIALDSSSLIAYLTGERGRDVEATEWCLEQNQAVLPPVVLTELLSDSTLSSSTQALFKAIPLLHVMDGFFERAGRLRARVLSRRLKAPLADTLIVQSCLDYNVPLVTRDSDFNKFQQLESLKIFAL